MPTANPRINVTLSPSLYSMVEELAKHQRISRSMVLRELLEAFNAGPAQGRAAVLERLTDIGFEYIRDAIQEQRQNSQSNDFDSPK